MDGTQSAEVIQVIRTTAKVGEGTEKDPVRIVTQYWDFEGHLLAENDPLVQRTTSIWKCDSKSKETQRGSIK